MAVAFCSDHGANLDSLMNGIRYSWLQREAEEQRARETAAREAAQRRSVPYKPGSIELPPLSRSPPTQVVLPKAQACEDKTRFLSGLDEAQGYPQPAHLRSHIAEHRATVKAEMLELQC